MKKQEPLAVFFFSIPLVILVFAIMNQEPKYQGKTAYQWVDEIKMPAKPAGPEPVLAALQEGEATQAVPFLRKALNSRRTSHRLKAAWALGQLGGRAEPAIPDLIKALEDKDKGVQINSARALARIGARDADLIPKVLPKLADSNLQMSGVAGDLLRTLAKQNPGTVSVNSFLSATSPKARVMGLPLVIEADEKIRKESITTLLNDTNGWVREQTVRLLKAKGLTETNIIPSSRAANLTTLLVSR